jgi:hypothetical protein
MSFDYKLSSTGLYELYPVSYISQYDENEYVYTDICNVQYLRFKTIEDVHTVAKIANVQEYQIIQHDNESMDSWHNSKVVYKSPLLQGAENINKEVQRKSQLELEEKMQQNQEFLSTFPNPKVLKVFNNGIKLVLHWTKYTNNNSKYYFTSASLHFIKNDDEPLTCYNIFRISDFQTINNKILRKKLKTYCTSVGLDEAGIIHMQNNVLEYKAELLKVHNLRVKE